MKLSGKQRELLELLARYKNATFVTGERSLRVLERHGLIERRRNLGYLESRITAAGRRALTAADDESGEGGA